MLGLRKDRISGLKAGNSTRSAHQTHSVAFPVKQKTWQQQLPSPILHNASVPGEREKSQPLGSQVQASNPEESS